MESRYSKEQLLDMYGSHAASGRPDINLGDLFLDWTPKAPSHVTNGELIKGEDPKDEVMGPELCWDNNGASIPLGLLDLTEDEIEVGGIFRV